MKKLLVIVFLISLSYSYAGSWKVVMSFNVIENYGFSAVGDKLFIGGGSNAVITDSTGPIGHVDVTKFARLTTDGGNTWNDVFSIKTTDTDSLFGVLKCTLNPEKIWYQTSEMMILAFDYKRFIITSRDTGRTWNRLDILDRVYKGDTLSDPEISITDGLHGSINYRKLPYIILTEDGFKSIKKINRPQDSIKCWTAQRFGENIIISVVDNSHLERYLMISENAGLTWRRQDVFQSFTNATNSGVLVKSINEFYNYGYEIDTATKKTYSVIYKTSDGGKSWRNTLRSYDSNTIHRGISPYGIAFAEDGIHGVALGCINSTTKIRSYFLTSDAGETWQKEYFDSVASKATSTTHAVMSTPDCFYFCDVCVIYKVWPFKDSMTVVSESLPESENPEVIIYPNPADRGRDINIRIQSTGRQSVSIELIDQSGHCLDRYFSPLIGSDAGLITYQPDKSIAPGAYIFRISTGDGLLVNKKIVIR